MKISNPFIFIAVFSLSMVACTSPSSDKNSDQQDEVIEETIAEPASVSFGNIEDGDTLTSPFEVVFEVSGMEIEPAGMVNEGKGHHHMVINDGDYVPEGEVIVADDTHIHYGQGQTSDSLKLTPGTYQLTMQFADGTHISYGEKLSNTIQVVVE